MWRLVTRLLVAAALAAARPCAAQEAAVDLLGASARGAAAAAAATTAPASSAGAVGAWAAGFPRRFVRRLVQPETVIRDPAQLQTVMDEVDHDTFNDNESRRDELASVARPLTQVAVSELDGQIGIVRAFLSYQAAQGLRAVGREAAATARWATARQVVARMSEDQRRVLSGTLERSDFGRRVVAEATAQGSGAFSSAVLREGNFVLMALVDTLIVSGIYDGLDVDTMKDKVLSIAPLCTSYTIERELPTNLVVGFLNRQLYEGLNGAFERLYRRALASQSTWGQALARADAVADAFGQSLYRGQAASPGAGSVTQRLGLVGVGAGEAFSLFGLCQRLTVGGAYALGGQFAIDSAGALLRGYPDRVMVGGNRDHYYVRQRLNDYQFQRTGRRLRDFLEERRLAWSDVVDEYRKWPVRSVAVPVTSMLGGYLGSVIAGTLFVAGGPVAMVGGVLVSTALAGLGGYVGNWAAVQLDRSPYMLRRRRAGYEERIATALRRADDFRAGTLGEARVVELARARALDFERLEVQGQYPTRIHYVERGADVQLVRRGEYVHQFVDPRRGEVFDDHANVRFDFVDRDGRQWKYDPDGGRMVDVGSVAANDGLRIIFVSREAAAVEGDVIVNREGAGLHVYPSGLVLEREAAGTWTVRGVGGNSDLVFRETGERFAFREGAFRRVRPAA